MAERRFSLFEKMFPDLRTDHGGITLGDVIERRNLALAAEVRRASAITPHHAREAEKTPVREREEA